MVPLPLAVGVALPLEELDGDAIHTGTDHRMTWMCTVCTSQNNAGIADCYQCGAVQPSPSKLASPTLISPRVLEASTLTASQRTSFHGAVSKCSPDCLCANVPLEFPLEIVPLHDRAVVESAEFYWQITRPLMYATPTLPLWLVKELSGQSKFTNRCTRAGLTKLITVAGGHGGFLLRPNPGHLDPVALFVMAKVRGDVVVAAKLKFEAQLEMESEQDPLGLKIDVKTNGYLFCAWWMPPELLQLVESVQRTLRAEGLRGCHMLAPENDQASQSPPLPFAVGCSIDSCTKRIPGGSRHDHPE